MQFINLSCSVLTICFIITFRELSKSSCGLGENHVALWAVDNGIGMGEEGGDGLATRALDVHVERVWALDGALKLVSQGLLRSGWVENIFSKSHGCVLC